MCPHSLEIDTKKDMKEPKIIRDAGYLYFLLGRMLGLAKMTTNNNLKEELLVLEKEIEETLKELKVLVF